jgi:ABC-type transport system involved in multi-copper enzyme maturation permease subunit
MVAPATTAGAICQDRSSGKLEQLFATDLSDSEILLGKLTARLLPVLGLVCCVLPVLALSVLLGGVDPLALAGAFLITVSLAVFGCSLALAFSVRATKPYEVLLATYALFAVWMLAVPVWDFLGWCWRFPTSPDWAIPLNPFYLAFAPYVQPGRVGAIGFLAFFTVILTVSAALATLAIRTMRTAFVYQLGDFAVRRPSRTRRSGIGLAPSLDGNPVLWQETRRTHPSPWVRTLIGSYLVLAVVFSVLAIADSLSSRSGTNPYLSAYVVAFQVAIGLPLVLISAATAVVEERARGSLDVLLATPLSTRQIVLSKWWGAFQNLPRLLLLLPMLVAVAAAWPVRSWLFVVYLGLFVVSGAAVWASIGLGLSTWVPRLGRAISLAVALYALVNLAWPVLALTLFQREGAGLSEVSCFYGCFDLTLVLCGWHHAHDWFSWISFWIVGQTAVSAGLLLAVLATFDRCVGRIRE